ncbi:MAG: AMP-binding protein [Paludibacter sp.]
MKAENIILNGKGYNRTNLENLHFADEPEDSWRNAIYHFLVNWFDDSDSIITHTSGSTGKPKEIRLRKAAMINSAGMTNYFFGLNADSTALLCMPASYIAGKMMLVRALVGGFYLIAVEPKANPFENLNQQVDFTAITPYQLFHSVESLKSGFIRKVIVGGSPVTSKLEQLVEEIHAEIYETYGMTETYSHIALRRINGKEKSDYFTVLNGVEIHQTKHGCLAVYAPHLSENELITNDIVDLKDSKSFRWLGRIDSVINSGGIKIHPEQVEKKLEKVILSNFFITSVPDHFLENKVVLIIESEEFTAEKVTELNTFFESNLSRFEIPKQIFYLPAFIYSESNKILRKESLAKAISQMTKENLC